MFTGIISEVGLIKNIKKGPTTTSLIIQSTLSSKEGDRLGDSIAVNGVCLTITHLEGELLHFDLSPETLATTTLGKLQFSHRVHLERALRLNDRLGGHLLSGHVDSLGLIQQAKKNGHHFLLGIQYPSSIAAFIVKKGSLGVDGVSLTIAHLEKDLLFVSIIPHTAKVTTLLGKKVGDMVNLEVDLLAKYVFQYLAHQPAQPAQPGQTGQPVQPILSSRDSSSHTNSSSNTGTTASGKLGKDFLTLHGFLS